MAGRKYRPIGLSGRMCVNCYALLFTGMPTVRFTSGAQRIIGREKWVFGSTGNMIVRHQLPLQLAWAISIHKSQV